MLTTTHKNTAPYVSTSQQHQHTTWLEIDALAFEHNVAQYKALVAPAQFAPVIKSNAYGHGIELIAQLCEKSSSVDRICVVNLSEAVKLRTCGVSKPILVLSIIDADLALAAIHDIALVIYDIDTARRLNAVATHINRKVAVHIKVDTGLSRLGVLASTAFEFIKTVFQMPHIFIEGILTHLAESESEDQTFTNQQLEIFKNLLLMLNKSGITIPLMHGSCSAALSANQNSHLTLNRGGIGVYGLWPSQANKAKAQSKIPGFSLKPILSWKTKIIQIKEVPAGSFIGYDRTHQVTRNSVLAVLPVGYWDGYDRGLSNKGKVVINQQHAPILGRISMNLTIVDVTDIQHVTLNDEVLLMANHPGITADDLAMYAGTINYEIVTRINPLLPRIVMNMR